MLLSNIRRTALCVEREAFAGASSKPRRLKSTLLCRRPGGLRHIQIEISLEGFLPALTCRRKAGAAGVFLQLSFILFVHSYFYYIHTFNLRRTHHGSTKQRTDNRVATGEGARQGAPALRARRCSAQHDPGTRRRGKSQLAQHASAFAIDSRRKGRKLQRRRRRSGARLGHDVRRGASFADLFPVRGGNHEAGGIRLELARKGHRKCREARNGQRHEAIPLVPRQSNSDGGQRRAGNDQRDQRQHVHDDDPIGRGAGVRGADDPDLRSDADHQPNVAAAWYQRTAADPISSTQTITVDNVPAGTVVERFDRARRA